MKERIRSIAALFPPLALLAVLLWMPAQAAAGARGGLSVCAGVIVPSLFPFLILSGLLRARGFPAALARRIGPVLTRLGLPPGAAAPFLLGLCGGYPVGAAAVAELVRSGTLTAEEGTRLLPVCNNTGPGFIVGVAGCAVFGSARAGAALYLCHVLAAVSLALFSGKRAGGRAARVCAPPAAGPASFPECVSSAARTTLDICGYVVFFSMLSSLVQSSGLFSVLASAAAQRFGADPRFCVSLLTGLLELGSGIAALRGLAPTPAHLALAAFLLGFGGLSVHAQTHYAVSGTSVRCARHFAGRILHGLLSAAYLVLLLALTRPRI